LPVWRVIHDLIGVPATGVDGADRDERPENRYVRTILGGIVASKRCRIPADSPFEVGLGRFIRVHGRAGPAVQGAGRPDAEDVGEVGCTGGDVYR
jgi:hypothetical protein